MISIFYMPQCQLAKQKVADIWKQCLLLTIEIITIVTGDPRLIVFFRDRRAQHIYRAESPDDGKTWTRPSKTTLPNNNSGIEASVLSSGSLAIVYNPTTKNRNPLSVSLSMDQGESRTVWTLTDQSKCKRIYFYSNIKCKIQNKDQCQTNNFHQSLNQSRYRETSGRSSTYFHPI